MALATRRKRRVNQPENVVRGECFMIVQEIAGGVEILAPAKLNLFLEVLARRPDGYHEIESLMVTVDLHDTLTFTEIRSGNRSSWHAMTGRLPTGSENLVVKAAERLKAATGCHARCADHPHQGDPGAGGPGRRVERCGGHAGGSRSDLGPARRPRAGSTPWRERSAAMWLSSCTLRPRSVAGEASKSSPSRCQEPLSLRPGLRRTSA